MVTLCFKAGHPSISLVATCASRLLPLELQTLRVTPAIAAGIADHVWSVRELLEDV
jgi:hypothetical protein